jgi:hypothetical protein
MCLAAESAVADGDPIPGLANFVGLSPLDVALAKQGKGELT